MVNKLKARVEVIARQNEEITGQKVFNLIPLFVEQLTEIVCPTVLLNQTDTILSTTWLSWIRLNMDCEDWEVIKRNAVFILTPHPPKIVNEKVIQLWN